MADWNAIKLGLNVLGVWLSFVAFGWALEALTRTEFGAEKERWAFYNVLILLQCVGNALVAATALLVTGQSLTGGVRSQSYALVGAAMLGAHKFGIGALRYVTYPMQVLCKSCKPVPVLVGEVLVAGQRHKPHKFIAVLLLVGGVATFMLNRPGKGAKGAVFEWNENTAWGLCLLAAALCCDGLYGPYQNYLKKKHPAMKGLHLMLNVNVWEGQLAASLLTVGWLTSDGGPCELRDAMAFVARHPEVRAKLAVVMGTMAVGCLFIFALQMAHGALVVTMTTTVRKLMSILFSVLWFGHAMAPVQWVAVMIVFTAGPMSRFFAGLFGFGPGAEPTKKTKDDGAEEEEPKKTK